jgi:hypothetical protein
MDPVRSYWPNGQIKSEEYKNSDNQYHRTDGPAVREWYESGKISLEMYIVCGRTHRVGGPAIRRWVSGSLLYESYCVDGLLNNTSGPAHIDYGATTVESYYVRGKLHNVNGPVYVQRSRDKIISEVYYACGERASKTEWLEKVVQPAVLKLISKLPYPIAVEISSQYRIV